MPAVAFAVQVSLGSVTLAPASSAVLAIAYTGEGSQMSGIQFDLSYDSSVVSINAIPGASIRSASKTLYSADISPSQRRFLVTGFNQNLLPDGPLLTLFLSVRPGVAAGPYYVSLTNITAAGSGGEATTAADVLAMVTVDALAGIVTPLQPAGILSTASELGGAVAPGEMITLMGSAIGPDATIRFDGVPAPLLYADGDQINAMVPFEVLGKTQTTMTLDRAGGRLASVPLDVTPAVPALFTLNATGTGQAAVSNVMDWSVNAALNPAPPGSLIVLYMTGAGQTDPPGVTGRITPVDEKGRLLLPVSVTIGGRSADVLYAGPAPALLSGVAAIVVRVPVDAEASPQVPVFVTVGEAVSPGDVWIAVGPAR